MAGIDNIIYEKSYTFAVRVIKAYKYLSQQHKEYVLSKQLLRSGTAKGAMVRESKFAQSRPDFLSKLYIALKEANEALYWIELLHDTDYIDDNTFASVHSDCDELVSILVKIVSTTKKSL